MAIARSYLFNISDLEILKTIKDRDYSATKIYAICYNLAKDLDNLNNIELYDKIIQEFNFLDRVITIGNVKEHLVTLDSIAKIVSNATSLGYTPEDFLDYLNQVSEEGLDIKLSLNKDSSNSVKIMTIHASKGLEYPICYFTGLGKKFNISDLKDKLYYDNNYGFITPYFNKSINNTILKTLLKTKYIQDEVSEKIRLFYVALTRAREKIILVGSFKENELAYKKENLINLEERLKYMSFRDIINSIYKYLTRYVKEIDINSLGLNKDYNLSKLVKEFNFNSTSKIIVDNYDVEEELIANKRVSKVVNKLLSSEEKKNIELGLRMHYLFEITDFNNPDYSMMNDFEKSCLKNFLNTKILDNNMGIYKEYEFVYNNKELIHGIIDLLIVKENTCIIVDYKLKYVDDSNYFKQLSYYREYIKDLTGKKTITYLYSIIDSKLILIEGD